MIKNKKGFSVVEVVIILAVVAGLVAAGWWFMNRKSTDEKEASSASQDSQLATVSDVSWQLGGNGWEAEGTPPACPDPLSIPPPVDVSKITSVLYPGQYRGNDYKPHGGFRFADGTNDDVTVSAPFDAVVYTGSRYIEMGEVQYMFVMINPCGLMYKFDHLLTLSDAFQAIADKLPEAKVDDSRTTNLEPQPTVKAGDVIATAVGFQNTGNTSVDFGVYDLRTKNAAYQSDSWKAEHQDDNEYAPYAICWLNYLTGNAKDIVLALPGADGQSGKTSDYCN